MSRFMGRGSEVIGSQIHNANNLNTPGSISKHSRSRRNPLEPVDPNLLFECVRLGECTPPNLTNSHVYRRDRLYVDPDGETEDYSEHQVHCAGSLSQSPVRHNPSLDNGLSNRLGGRNGSSIPTSRPINSSGLGGRKRAGNGVTVPLVPNLVRPAQVFHRNMGSPIVVLGSSSYHRPSLPQRSRPRSKLKKKKSKIDLFGYPASPRTGKAFKARLKTLVRFYYRDVHLPWTKESDEFKFIIEALLEHFSNACWDDGVVVKCVSSILRRRRHEFRKVAASGGRKPVHCSKESWQYFVKEAKAHKANLEWNAQQLRAIQARAGPRTRLGSGGVASFCNRFLQRFGSLPTFEQIEQAKSAGAKRFFQDFNDSNLDVLGDDELVSSSEDSDESAFSGH